MNEKSLNKILLIVLVLQTILTTASFQRVRSELITLKAQCAAQQENLEILNKAVALDLGFKDKGNKPE